VIAFMLFFRALFHNAAAALVEPNTQEEK